MQIMKKNTTGVHEKNRPTAISQLVIQKDLSKQKYSALRRLIPGQYGTKIRRQAPI